MKSNNKVNNKDKLSLEDRANLSIEIEKKQAKEWEEHQLYNIESKQVQLEYINDLSNKQIDNTIEYHNKAKKILHDSKVNNNQLIEELNTIKTNENNQRIDTILKLKSTTDQIHNEISINAARNVKLKNDKINDLNKNKNDLLSQGLNPYVVYRKKEILNDEIKQKNKLINNISNNKTLLYDTLSNELDIKKHREAEKLKLLEYEKNHRAEQGRPYIEKHNNNYIKSITIDNKEILDPTNRQIHIYPSQLTEIPDYSFGLGKSSKIPIDIRNRIMKRMQEKLGIDDNNLGEYKRLISFIDNDNSTIAVTNDFDKKTTELVDRPLDIPGLTIAKEELVDKTNTYNDISNQINNESNNNDKKYTIKPLSKLETNIIQRNLTKQHQTFIEGKQQIAGGKVFPKNLSGFISKPDVILFKDFDVGLTYNMKFLLTNTSYTFNNFHLLDIVDKYIDFFEISYIKPGRMSAGMSCSISITFNPKLNEDIHTTIEVISDTGPVSIPLICLKKRCAPRIINPLIDFNQITIGQKSKQTISIYNSQALPSNYKIIKKQANDLDNKLDSSIENKQENPKKNIEKIDFSNCDNANSSNELTNRVNSFMLRKLNRQQNEHPEPITLSSYGGKLDGYATIEIDVHCTPLVEGQYNYEYIVIFDGVIENTLDMAKDDLNNHVLSQQAVTISYNCISLPIYMKTFTIDLKTIYYDTIYRSVVILHNNSNITQQINIKLSNIYKEIIVIQPSTVYIQPNSDITLNIKVILNLMNVLNLKYFSYILSNGTNQSLLLPIEVQNINQLLPIYFLIKFDVTSSVLQFSNTTLDYGLSYTNQTFSLPIDIYNPGLLPQKLLITKLNKDITISPDNIKIILPFEKITFSVLLNIKKIGSMKYVFDILSNLTNSYHITVLAQCFDPPLSISSNNIVLQSISPGYKVNTNIYLTNPTKFKQNYELILPNKLMSWLTISPNVIELLPNQTNRLEIEFHPPFHIVDIDPMDWFYNTMKTLTDKLGNKIVSNLDNNSEFKLDKVENKFDNKSDNKVDTKVDIKADNKVESKSTKNNKSISKLSSKAENKKLDSKTESKTDNKLADKLDSPVENQSNLTSTTNKEQINNIENKMISLVNDISLLPLIDQYNYTDDEHWVNISNLLGEITWKKNQNKVVNTSEEVSEEEIDRLINDDNNEIDWGINSLWKLPIFIKSTNPQSTVRPYYINIDTTVIPSDILVDIKEIDFGQIPIGTRILKTIKIYNNNSKDKMNLKQINCFNSIGPFTILNSIRPINPKSFISLIIECLPLYNGIYMDSLTVTSDICTHIISVPIKVYGIKPSIEISGLTTGIINNKGILDFGNVIVNDQMKQTINLINKSNFNIDIYINRYISQNISNYNNHSYIPKNKSNLPVFSYQPEYIQCLPNISYPIEITFQPDRYIYEPYLDYLNIYIGNDIDPKDKLQIGLFGRVVNRQLYLLPESIDDELVLTEKYKLFPTITDLYSNTFVNATNKDIKKHELDILSTTGLINPVIYPNIELQFEDLFNESTDPSKFINNTNTRQQIKKLVIYSNKIYDINSLNGPNFVPDKNNTASGSVGSFEIITPPDTKQSNIYTVTPDKGTIPIGGSITIDITCTIPKPRDLNGLVIGNWITHKIEVVTKGGWCPLSETEENRHTVLLKSYKNL